MNITVGFDVTFMNARDKVGGIFQYAERLISMLVSHTGMNIVAMVPAQDGNIFESLKGYPNFKEIPIGISALFSEIVERENIEVIHRPLQYYRRCTLSVPMIITLHDIQHFHYPEFFTDEKIKFRNIFYKRSAEFSERVIVSFNHVKEDLIKFYGIPFNKIDICGVGMEEPKSLNPSILQGIKNKYEIPESYLFYAANTWRHKNHINLIKALRIVHDKYQQKISLVCTGQKTQDFFPEIEKEINKLALNGVVKFLGYIPEEEMLLIMSNATLVVIPTLYEAGSYPLLEAMTYSVPVICSSVTSLPEHIGDSRFIFDPHNVDGIAEKINLMLIDEKLRKENIENSRRQIDKIKWEEKVWTFVESYRKAIDGFNRKKRDISFPFSEFVCNYEFLLNSYYENILNKREDIIKRKDEIIKSKDEKIQRKEEIIRSMQKSLSWRITELLRKLAKL